MKVIETAIPDVKIFEPTIFGDNRGFFFESYNQVVFEQTIGRHINFVQDNHSRSCKGVLRGLHYQNPPMAQAKLVRVTQGEVYDVAVDVRKGSTTYGKWVGVILSAENRRQLWIPEGFAHGFYVRSDVADFLYKTTEYYSPQHEGSIYWADPYLAIDWQLDNDPIISEKDRKAQPLSSLSDITP